eukprot:2357011-Pyramimonas_sp.AAC.1
MRGRVWACRFPVHSRSGGRGEGAQATSGGVCFRRDRREGGEKEKTSECDHQRQGGAGGGGGGPHARQPRPGDARQRQSARRAARRAAAHLPHLLHGARLKRPCRCRAQLVALCSLALSVHGIALSIHGMALLVHGMARYAGR